MRRAGCHRLGSRGIIGFRRKWRSAILVASLALGRHIQEMDRKQASIPLWRLILGFLIAPLVAALAIAIIQPAYDGLDSYSDRIYRTTIAFAVFGGYPWALLFGIPAYFALRNRARASVLNCALVGAVIASFPWFVLGLLFRPDYAESDSRVTVLNGSRTLAGWFEFGELIAFVAVSGAFAGAVFWLVVAAGKSRSSIQMMD